MSALVEQEDRERTLCDAVIHHVLDEWHISDLVMHWKEAAGHWKEIDISADIERKLFTGTQGGPIVTHALTDDDDEDESQSPSTKPDAFANSPTSPRSPENDNANYSPQSPANPSLYVQLPPAQGMSPCREESIGSPNERRSLESVPTQRSNHSRRQSSPKAGTLSQRRSSMYDSINEALVQSIEKEKKESEGAPLITWRTFATFTAELASSIFPARTAECFGLPATSSRT